MFQPTPTKQCPNCGNVMYLRSKDGSQFWGCKMWKENGCKTLPYEQKTMQISTQTTQTLPSQPKEVINGSLILADEIKALREVINELGVKIDTLLNKIKEELDIK